jgi:glutamyl-tRNA synthetase
LPDKDLKPIVERYALENALTHDGKADLKAVMNKVMGERPDLKARAKETVPIIRAVVDEVNKLDKAEQEKRLADLGGPMEHVKVEARTGLPPLENVKGQVVMRFAPGPSGPLHIGNTRAAILNDEYCKMYKGTFINRIEDTDPDRIMPEAYDWIPEDMAWLGIKVDKKVVQSDRFELYFEHAKKLLEMGHAYVCTCRPDEWRELKNQKKACPHRDRPPADQLDGWDKMRSGAYGQEEAAVIVKTDLGHPNPAIRDWPAVRICETPHPRLGTKYRIYPLMNFSVALDDHLLGLTHVLRGKDHLNNTYRQEYLYKYFSWVMPEYIHYGRVAIKGLELSKSKMKLGIDEGRYLGWDDPRLGSVRALAKRGIEPEAIRRYWVQVGPKQVDIEFSWQTLFSYNKEIVDPKANRFFFVEGPRHVRIEGKGSELLEGHAPLHPADPTRGTRKVLVRGKDGVLVQAADIEGLGPGTVVRLKDLGNIKLRSQELAEYIGGDLSVLKEGAKNIQWVHPTENLETMIHMPDGTDIAGRCEVLTRTSAGKVVQFERFGFVRIEEHDGKMIGWFAHK